jgi:hypothetical protein
VADYAKRIGKSSKGGDWRNCSLWLDHADSLATLSVWRRKASYSSIVHLRRISVSGESVKTSEKRKAIRILWKRRGGALQKQHLPLRYTFFSSSRSFDQVVGFFTLVTSVRKPEAIPFFEMHLF